jgi:hypothetical protein
MVCYRNKTKKEARWDTASSYLLCQTTALSLPTCAKPLPSLKGDQLNVAWIFQLLAISRESSLTYFDGGDERATQSERRYDWSGSLKVSIQIYFECFKALLTRER